MPQEAGAFEGGAPTAHGIPTDDDGGALADALKGAQGHPNFLQRMFPSIFGGGTPAGAVSGSTQAGMAQLVGMGMQPGDAAGFLGNFQTESGLNPQAVGPDGAHWGIAQWNAERRKAIEDHFHKNLMDMSFGEQIGAAHWEAYEGPYKRVGAELTAGSHESGRAAAIIDRDYEMPASPGSLALLKEDAARGANAHLAMQGYDPGAQRMAADAQTSPPTTATATPSVAATEARLAKLRVEVVHTNPPAGATLHVTSDSPDHVIDPPRTMGAMPDSGQQRNVVRDGY